MGMVVVPTPGGGEGTGDGMETALGAALGPQVSQAFCHGCCFQFPCWGRRKELQSPSDMLRSQRWEGLTPQRVLFSLPLFPRFQRIPPVPLVIVTSPCAFTISRNPGSGEVAWPIPMSPASPITLGVDQAPSVPREGSPATPQPGRHPLPGPCTR